MHRPKILPGGQTCCGLTDPTIKWYTSKESGYSLPARSREEAESKARTAVASALRNANTRQLTTATRAALARELKRGIKMKECCLRDLQPVWNILNIVRE